MAKQRSSKGLLYAPSTTPNYSDAERESWLDQAVAGFRTQGQANRDYYAVILRELWPKGHGLPGPVRTEEEIRAAVNRFREERGQPPYKDVFRRLRELQGDEGFTSIIKEGVKYQLTSREMAPKREPRGKPSKQLWEAILHASDHRCANCGLSEPDITLSWDHRVPRSRGGTNEDTNWQPLCEQCNILKSAACQRCTFNCLICPWAYPETYKPIVLDDHNREQIRREAERRKVSSSMVANEIVRQHFQKSRR